MEQKTGRGRPKGSGGTKKIVTIYLDEEIIDYFRQKSAEAHLPYQTLINLYLLDCVKQQKRLNISWDSAEP